MKAKDKEIAVVYGGQVKALGNGKVGGYLVMFGSEQEPDLSEMRDWFAKDTDFDIKDGDPTTILYSHTLDPVIGNRKLGRGSLKITDVGVWVEGQLQLRDDYERAIYEMVEAGKLGWSSGAPSYLIRREEVGDTHKITHWPLGKDASLTPTPAEPRIVATALKSLELPKADWSAIDRKLFHPLTGKSFEVPKAPSIPANPYLRKLSNFLGVGVKDVFNTCRFVSPVEMGNYLHAVKMVTHDHTQLDIRNIREDGGEYPPQHETIKLNSKITDSFLVNGMAFMSAPSLRYTIKAALEWDGILLTFYCRKSDSDTLCGIISEAGKYADDNHVLRGEAFALSGEILERKSTSWDEIFLSNDVKESLKRAAAVLGAKGKSAPSRGMIFMGPPGTGKTLSGRGLRDNTKTTFIWVSAKDFHRCGAFRGLYSGFKLARNLAPSILFVEDVDNWLDSYTIDMLKTEMDGIEQHSGVLTVLTTNYPERLPKALIDRPGRFDEVMKVDLPDAAIREQMIRAWFKDLTDVAAIEAIVVDTNGYSGAHIREISKYAYSIRDEKSVDIAEAVKIAIEKIKSQRAIIDAAQLEDSNYRPKSLLAEFCAKSMKLYIKTFSDDDRAAFEAKLREESAENVTSAHDKAHKWAESGALPDGVSRADLVWVHDAIIAELKRRFLEENPEGTYEHDTPLTIDDIADPAEPSGDTEAGDDSAGAEAGEDQKGRFLLALFAGASKAIPFKGTQRAPINTPWDSAEFTASADAEMEDNYAYGDLFPHHKTVNGETKTIFRGAVLGMAKILGAFFPAPVRNDDIGKSAYDHLAQEYNLHDRRAPEFRQYSFKEFVAFHVEQKCEMDWFVESVTKSVIASVMECAGYDALLKAVTALEPEDHREEAARKEEEQFGIAAEKLEADISDYKKNMLTLDTAVGLVDAVRKTLTTIRLARRVPRGRYVP